MGGCLSGGARRVRPFPTAFPTRVSLRRCSLVAGRLVIDAELVVDVHHARDALDDVLGQPLGVAARHSPHERDLPVLDLHLDVAGVDVAVLREPFADVFPDALVGPLISLGASPREGTGLTPGVRGRAALAVLALAVGTGLSITPRPEAALPGAPGPEAALAVARPLTLPVAALPELAPRARGNPRRSLRVAGGALSVQVCLWPVALRVAPAPAIPGRPGFVLVLIPAVVHASAPLLLVAAVCASLVVHAAILAAPALGSLIVMSSHLPSLLWLCTRRRVLRRGPRPVAG